MDKYLLKNLKETHPSHKQVEKILLEEREGKYNTFYKINMLLKKIKRPSNDLFQILDISRSINLILDEDTINPLLSGDDINIILSKVADIKSKGFFIDHVSYEQDFSIVEHDEISQREVEHYYNDYSSFSDLKNLDITEKLETYEKIQELLSDLSSRERQIIEFRFGLNDKEELSYEKIAKLFDRSLETIRQIERKTLKGFRTRSNIYEFNLLVNGVFIESKEDDISMDRSISKYNTSIESSINNDDIAKIFKHINRSKKDFSEYKEDNISIENSIKKDDITKILRSVRASKKDSSEQNDNSWTLIKEDKPLKDDCKSLIPETKIVKYSPYKPNKPINKEEKEQEIFNISLAIEKAKMTNCHRYAFHLKEVRLRLSICLKSELEKLNPLKSSRKHRVITEHSSIIRDFIKFAEKEAKNKINNIDIDDVKLEMKIIIEREVTMFNLGSGTYDNFSIIINYYKEMCYAKMFSAYLYLELSMEKIDELEDTFSDDYFSFAKEEIINYSRRTTSQQQEEILSREKIRINRENKNMFNG